MNGLVLSTADRSKVAIRSLSVPLERRPPDQQLQQEFSALLLAKVIFMDIWGFSHIFCSLWCQRLLLPTKCATEGGGQEGNVSAKKHFLPNLLLFEDLSTLDQILVNIVISVRLVLLFKSVLFYHTNVYGLGLFFPKSSLILRYLTFLFESFVN